MDPVRAFPIDLGDFDERPVLGEQPGDACADAVATAGDDRDASVEEPIPVVDGRDASSPVMATDFSGVFDLSGQIVDQCQIGERPGQRVGEGWHR